MKSDRIENTASAYQYLEVPFVGELLCLPPCIMMMVSTVALVKQVPGPFNGLTQYFLIGLHWKMMRKNKGT